MAFLFQHYEMSEIIHCVIASFCTFDDFWPRFYITVLGMTFFSISSNLLFPMFIWTFIFFFYLDFYFPFLWELFNFFFSFFFIFYFNSSSNSFFIQSWSHFGFLPIFFSLTSFWWYWHVMKDQAKYKLEFDKPLYQTFW